MSSLNKKNLQGDKIAWGKWSALNSDYFGNPKVIEALFNIFTKDRPQLPSRLDIADLGSAD